MAKKKIERLTPEQLDANYIKFIKDKELNPNGLAEFEKVIKAAVVTKQRGSK